MKTMAKLRKEYGDSPLLERGLKSDPLKQFQLWLKEAIKNGEKEPNAMILSTTSLTKQPSSRAVLLKKLDDQGFLFFTNYKSRKGDELKSNPKASLNFLWHSLHRQVMIEGKVKKTSRKESESYFASRPRGAQIATHASMQGEPLANRLELEMEFKRLEKLFKDKKIPCPKYWGGYRLIPDRIEFWQGRKDRLHDRILYVLANGIWVMSRLSP